MSGHSKWYETLKKWFRKKVRTEVGAWERARARVCVKTSKNSNVCISGITQPIELKFSKVKVSLSSV